MGYIVMPLFSLLIVSITILLSGCGGGGGKNRSSNSGNKNSMSITDMQSALSNIESSELSEDEERSLLYVREEEKLARDVYIALDNRWGGYLKAFNNISNAEQTHTDAVKLLLERYSLEDPVTEEEDLNLGVFQNETLQNLYDDLVASGSQSLVDALIVGATIEDLDIYDIELEMESVDNEDILYVYQKLVDGSENHMRAFVKNLQKESSDYSPVYITDDRYEAIFD